MCPYIEFLPFLVFLLRSQYQLLTSGAVRGTTAVGPRSRRAVTANPGMMNRPLAGNARQARSVREGGNLLNGRAVSTTVVDG